MPRLNEDQQLLAESAKQILEAEAPISRFRVLRDAGQTQDQPLWAQLVELGWPAIPFSEEAGGMGWGLPEICIVMEALGNHLAMTPMLSVMLAGVLDPDAGAAEGRVVALASREGSAHQGPEISPCASRVTAGRLSGAKGPVLDGMAADVFLVTAMDGEELALFRVDAADAERRALGRLDSRDAAQVDFNEAPAERLPITLEALDQAMDQATVAISAEMLGGAQAALDMTLAYLKERVQFDKPIGSFQVLQHRAVDCYIAIALARAAVYAAARDPDPLLVSLAKTRCNDAFLEVAKEAVQLHGGIGMTDEHDIGFLLKRARVASLTLGTSAYHRDRWGRLQGY
jgi:alkylation response protein AidB-like acyl-CoA dehydrogenase